MWMKGARARNEDYHLKGEAHEVAENLLNVGSRHVSGDKERYSGSGKHPEQVRMR
jgi:hypothetical protein